MVLPLLILGAAAWFAKTKYDEFTEAKNVVVFGFSQSGKTSAVNALTGSAHKIGSTNQGTTTTTIKTEYRKSNQNFVFWDVPGLNDFASSKITSSTVSNCLIQLMKDTSNGINLLMFVVTLDEIKQPSFKEQYRLIVHILTQCKIPCIMVITKLEQEALKPFGQDAAPYELANAIHNYPIDKKLINRDVKVVGDESTQLFQKLESVVGACFLQNENFKKITNHSTAKIWAEIEQKSTPHPIKYHSDHDLMSANIMKCYNVFVSKFNKRDAYGYEDKNLNDTFIKLGFSESESKINVQNF